MKQERGLTLDRSRCSGNYRILTTLHEIQIHIRTTNPVERVKERESPASGPRRGTAGRITVGVRGPVTGSAAGASLRGRQHPSQAGVWEQLPPSVNRMKGIFTRKNSRHAHLLRDFRLNENIFCNKLSGDPS